MNLDQIETKCFILALFIRDDGERFLLGSRAYEFLDSQLHFAANTYQNDIVEVQGNDGIMLAGQVRRATSQAFDGYIGDSSVNRTTIEQYRQDFLKFFRKNHYYKVVYVFPNGSAIQRRNGFIVEAPEVKELYQLFPQYHISMNFEDINYYEYKEDEDGQEIYGESANLNVSTAATGGLIWEEQTQTTTTKEGTNFTILGTEFGGSIDNVKLSGDTYQQTYSGKNLYKVPDTQSKNGVTVTHNADGTFNVSTGSGTATANTTIYIMVNESLASGTYTLSKSVDNSDLGIIIQDYNNASWVSNLMTLTTGTQKTATLNPTGNRTSCVIQILSGVSINVQNVKVQLEANSVPTSFEPYVGGVPAPNPDYPQEVQTVTGRQVVTVSDGSSQSQEYEVNLGKNLFDKNTVTSGKYINYDGTIANNEPWNISDYIPIQPNTTYVTSTGSGGLGNLPARCYYDANKTYISGKAHSGASPFVDTSPAGAAYMRESILTAALNTAQVEKGSTPTTYASYFTPIELCKIGTYQDYIYKSGDDWYLHKNIVKKIFDGTEAWTVSSSWWSSDKNYYGAFCYFSDLAKLGAENEYNYALFCDNLSETQTTAMIKGGLAEGIKQSGGNSDQYIAIGLSKTRLSDVSSGYNTRQSIKAWLGTNNTIVYGVLATATDTQITNTALIAQLEALAGATTYASQTIFTVTSPNQLGILSLSTTVIDGGGVVWDSIGATWEEGTGGGPTMISVDSIDNVYPIWEVTGPAVNPQISVLTTNTTLSYTGTITSSQTLKVDMFNKTAILNGTSVIGNVSGDWVNLAPGINRVTYTTNNADAPDSTLWWQEIVG